MAIGIEEASALVDRAGKLVDALEAGDLARRLQVIAQAGELETMRSP
jgi:hypothetical protein